MNKLGILIYPLLFTEELNEEIQINCEGIVEEIHGQNGNKELHLLIIIYIFIKKY